MIVFLRHTIAGATLATAALLVPSSSFADPNPMITPDIDVWLMRGTKVKVDDDFKRARELFSFCGIGVGTPTIHDMTDMTRHPNTAANLDNSCDNKGPDGSKETPDAGAKALRKEIGFTRGRVNVYYLGNPGAVPGLLPAALGYWCGRRNPCKPGSSADQLETCNTVIVNATDSDHETLAHELGHAYSLKHTNAVPANNLMREKRTGPRSTLTEAQCSDMKKNKNSMLNVNRAIIPAK